MNEGNQWLTPFMAVDSGFTKSGLPKDDSKKCYRVHYAVKRPIVSSIITCVALGVTALPLVGLLLLVTCWDLTGPGAIPFIVIFTLFSAAIAAAIWYTLKFAYKVNPITLSATGIEFCPTWNADLLSRLNRDWSDLHSIEFNGSLKMQDVANWTALYGSSIALDFKSGGSALLEIESMKREQVENFFLWIEQHCDQSVFSRNAILFERNLLSMVKEGKSYTAIWTDALDSQFATTHFVPLRTGSKLQEEQYEVRVQLASSGMSAVYLAKNQLGERVILKESVLPIDTDSQTKAKAKELFDREANLLAKISHDKIAKLEDYFTEAGRDYIVLKYIPGISLRQLAEQDATKSQQQCLSYGQQLADILTYLHGLQPPIIHRDLTPDNIIVRDDGKIAIIDFGVSNEFVGKATGTMVGKQSYIPPEQFRGKAEPKSDIYALGATMYFLLTQKDPEPLSQSSPLIVSRTVSKELDDLIVRCTNLESAERPDASGLAAECARIATRSKN